MAADETLEGIRKKKKGRIPESADELTTEVMRKDPELMKIIADYCEATGASPTEFIKSAIMNFSTTRKEILSKMTAEDLYASWSVLKEFMIHAKNIFFDYANLIFSDQTQNLTTLIAAGRAEATAKVEIGVGEKKGSELDERLRDKMWTMIEPVLDYVVASAFKMTGMPTPKGLKIPIAVGELTEDEIPPELRRPAT